jgi:hypothetical protein
MKPLYAAFVVLGALLLPHHAHATSLGIIDGAPCDLTQRPPVENTLYAELAAWLGRPLDIAHMYMISTPPNWNAWEGSYETVIACLGLPATRNKAVHISVPMLVTGGTLVQGASGQYDAEFLKLGNALVSAGLSHATLRIGWEFNGNWYLWAAAKDPADWVTYWRRIVTALRAVPGQHFIIDWCPNRGGPSMNAALAYPGDGFVDYIGMDFYDPPSSVGDDLTRWTLVAHKAQGLDWLVSFAHLHGKPYAIDEWGLSSQNAGDDPGFVQQVGVWFAVNRPTWHIVFTIPNSGGSDFNFDAMPASGARYCALFSLPGAACLSGAVEPEPAK